MIQRCKKSTKLFQLHDFQVFKCHIESFLKQEALSIPSPTMKIINLYYLNIVLFTLIYLLQGIKMTSSDEALFFFIIIILLTFKHLFQYQLLTNIVFLVCVLFYIIKCKSYAFQKSYCLEINFTIHHFGVLAVITARDNTLTQFTTLFKNVCVYISIQTMPLKIQQD